MISLMRGRLDRERETIRIMIGMYCRRRHRAAEMLCTECGLLLAYAMERIDRCPYGYAKPACTNCPIHCYRPEMREQIRRVMRYAGPRMLPAHPILTVRHWIDAYRLRCSARP
jgi:hypothetical protein